MTLDHVGLEVQDLFRQELFYRRALGFALRYRYVSRNSPGLRTVFLVRDGVALELLERPRAEGFLAGRAAAPNHLSLGVPDVDAAYAQLVALAWPDVTLRPPRDTGDGYRELTLQDPEGNIVELGARIRPEPRYPIRAVVFDLDGTLVDSEETYYLADRALLETYGIPFSREDKRRYVGGGNRDMMIDLVRRFDLPESPEALGRRKDALYLELARAGMQVFPEMRSFLERARARGLPTAVASGSSPTVIAAILDGVGLAPAFDAAVSAEEVPRGKPAPDVFLEAARRLGVPAHECLAVEDSHQGVEAAARAFMRCIAVPSFAEPPLPAAFTLADLLFEGGMPAFEAARADRWVEAQGIG